MKVTVSAHGRWHAYELANGLFQRGMLQCLLTTYPEFVARRFLDPGLALKTAPWLEARRRLYHKLSIGDKPDAVIARSFGRFAARHAINDADLLVGWSSATLEAIAPAQSAGMKVVIERGSSHIGHQTDILTNAYADFGTPFAGTAPEIIERELAEYQVADAIAVPSRFAAETFTARGIEVHKLIVNPYGVDLSKFKPDPVERPVTRIVFVGSVGIRKGVPWLLRAFKGLERIAELHLIGPVEKGFQSILAANMPKNVKVHGALPLQAVADELRLSDIFCLPSLEEGFPLSMLQAMASGLAVVSTRESGADDIINEGKEGLIVGSCDHRSLHHALAHLVENPDLRRAMGDAARVRVVTGYSWDDYVDRSIEAYKNLLGT